MPEGAKDLDSADSGFGLCLAKVMIDLVQPILARRHKGVNTDCVFER